jgi:hypothetical protein
VSKALSFVLAFFLDRSGIPDLIDLCLGSIFLSISFIHLLPRASSHLSGHYPFASLVAMCVFAFLTLFSFIRDSIALMDENILTTCEPVGSAAHSTAQLTDTQPDLPGFIWSDHIPAVALYVVGLADATATAIWISTLELPEIHARTGVVLALGFIEFAAMGRFVAAIGMPIALFCILSALAAIGPSILIACSFKNPGGARSAAGYAASVLLGLYLFVGSIAVYTGITQTRRSVGVTMAVLVLSFAMPIAIRAGDQ